MSGNAAKFANCNLQIVNCTSATLTPGSSSGIMTYWVFRPIPAQTPMISIIEFPANMGPANASVTFSSNSQSLLTLTATSQSKQEYILDAVTPNGMSSNPNLVLAVNRSASITAGKASDVVWMPWGGTTSHKYPVAIVAQNNLTFGMALVDLSLLYPNGSGMVQKMLGLINAQTLTATDEAALFNALITTAALHGASWMTQTANTLANKKLSSICLPGTHDSGTWTLTGSTTNSNDCNTQTQAVSILGQLNRGARYFDMRPCFGTNKKGQSDLVLTHFGNFVGGWFGSFGQSLQSALDDVATFIEQSCGENELIILKFSHFADLVVGDWTPSPMSSDCYLQISLMVNATLGKYLFASTDPTINLNAQTINTLKAQTTSRKPYVLALFDVGYEKNAALAFPSNLISPSTGLFAYGDMAAQKIQYTIKPNFVLYDLYSNINNFSKMAADQKKKLTAYTPSPTSSFLLSWTLTCSKTPGCTGAVVGKVKNIACIGKMAQYTNPLLTGTLMSWLSQGVLNKGRIPNILYLDWFGEFADESVVLAAEINARIPNPAL